MVPELEDLTYEERLKEMHLSTHKETREIGDLTTIYKLMNNLQKTDRKDLILIGMCVPIKERGLSRPLQVRLPYL